MVISNSVFHASPLEEGKAGMEEGAIEKNEEAIEEKEERKNGGKIETFSHLVEDKGRESSSGSDFLSSETTTGHEEQSPSTSTEESSSSPSIGKLVQEIAAPICTNPCGIGDGGKKRLLDNKKQVSELPEIEMMKERFAKLLLGEDMSGCGNGVPTALAISNAITNLYATLFGQILRLEPLPQGRKAMWRREMEWLLSVSDHIVELAPTWQTFPDGSELEVMTSRPRSDLYVNLPALRKLDNMLLEILDRFVDTEFWYVDQGLLAPPNDDGGDGGDSSIKRVLKRQEEKWWLPVPRVPPCGLDENLRKQLQHKRDSTNQILKAAMAINNITLAEMDIPESYLESLPKTARASLGDLIYGYISSEQFSCESLLDCLDLSSEHQAMEVANRVEASIYIWRKRTNSKPGTNAPRLSTKTSWEMVKDLMVDADKWELLAERAESLMLSLRQRFPGLPQTTLDMTKIQHNKDIGKSILESYSRVLESLAFNIAARIDDVLFVDDLTKHSHVHFSSLSKVSVIGHKRIQASIPSSPTPSTKASAFTTPTLTPSKVISPFKGEEATQRGGGVRRILTDFLSIDTKGEGQNNPIERDLKSRECTEETVDQRM